MFLSNKRKNIHSNFSFYAISLSLISALTGIIGYSMSFTQNKELTSYYIYSSSISFLFQICTYSVLNYKKNAVIGRFKYTFNIRNSIIQFLVLNILLIFSVILVFVYFYKGEAEELGFIILIQLIFSYLQMLSFNESIYFQLTKIDHYLKIQFLSTIARAFTVFILVYFLEFSFWGLIFSNIVAAFSICFFYNIKFKYLLYNYKIGFKKIKLIRSIFKLEGVLRSYRGYSEAWMVTTIISILNITKILGQTELNLINFSVPYINSISTNFRQFFIKFERESYLGNLKSNQFLFTYLILVPLPFLFYFKKNLALFIERIGFNSIINLFDTNFLILISLQLIILPFTLGYVFIDYSRKNIYYKFLTHKIIMLIILIFLTLALYKNFKINFIFVLLPLLPTLAIALNKKYLIEKHI